MTAPKSTIWDLEPHTRAKHEILKRYLQAWIPILTRKGGFPSVLYIDGFAGPGRYSKGEKGSPIIALEAALAHVETIQGAIGFHFIEKDKKRAEFLEQLVKEIPCPSNFRVKIDKAPFEDAFSKTYHDHMNGRKRLPPTFAFIDPFGWKVPFSIVKFIMSNRSCEVLVNFMYEEINRFIGHPDQTSNFDSFFGTEAWREGIKLEDPRERNRFLHDLYYQQLKTEAGSNYVRSFEMKNFKGVADYYLFYATNSRLGLQKMKEAMWKVDESGEFTFSDATDPNQLVLFENKPNFEILKNQILEQFSGSEATVAEIEEFILAETAYRETHYKRQILRPMELSKPPGIQVVNAPPPRKPGTFPDKKLRIRFLA